MLVSVDVEDAKCTMYAAVVDEEVNCSASGQGGLAGGAIGRPRDQEEGEGARSAKAEAASEAAERFLDEEEADMPTARITTELEADKAVDRLSERAVERAAGRSTDRTADKTEGRAAERRAKEGGGRARGLRAPFGQAPATVKPSLPDSPTMGPHPNRTSR